MRVQSRRLMRCALGRAPGAARPFHRTTRVSVAVPDDGETRTRSSTSLALLLIVLLTALQLPGEGVVAAPIIDVQLDARSCPMAEVGGTVRYDLIAYNHGFAEASEVEVSHILPAGFSYLGGSTRVSLEGEVISLQDPEVTGPTLKWGAFSLPAGQGVFRSHYGIHTFVQDLCAEGYVDFQLDRALDLVGVGGYVTQLLYPITRSTSGAHPCWAYFVQAAYDRGLVPVVRLQGEWGGDFWIKPESDTPGNYSSIAQAFRRVVEGLPRRSGAKLYVQIWNEPDLSLEWGGESSAWEYGHFLVDVARAIHAIGDPKIKVLNGALTPGNVLFTRQLIDVPGFVSSFDLWASHCYPLNHPPTYNIHDGTARYPQYTTDCYLLELRALRDYGGRRGIKVIVTETGYGLHDRTFRFEGYPTIDEDNRAYYMKRAFRDFWPAWKEVVAATPFELVDPYSSWQRWDWLRPGSDVPHKQYNAVSALAKPEPLEITPSRLIISFTAIAADFPGSYSSDILAVAANTTVDPLNGAAPVVVLDRLHTLQFPLASAAITAEGGSVAGELGRGAVAGLDDVLDRIDLRSLEARSAQRESVQYLGDPVRPSEALKLVATVPLGTDPRSLALDVSRGRAYIALGGGSLTTVDLDGRRVLCGVRVGDDPSAVGANSATGAVYVANRGDGTVSEVGSEGCGQVRTAGGLSEPSDLAVDSDRQSLYVTDSQSGEVVVFDLKSFRAAHRIDIGAYADALAIDRSLGVLYVASNGGDGTVSALSLDSLSLLRTIEVARGPLLDLAVDEAGGQVYVLHLGPAPRRQVTIVDGPRMELLTSLAGGWAWPWDHTYHLAMDPEKGLLHLADSQQLVSLDAGSLTLSSITPLGVVVDASGLAVDSSEGLVYVVDGLSGDLLIFGGRESD